MKKTVIALCAVVIAALMLVGCGSKTAFTINDGVIQENGTYSVSATLEGGSGKASIETPVKVTVKDKTMTATVVWSSSNYDLMVVDGVKYTPTTIKPGSTFEVPVAALDKPMAISAQTNAMGTPHLIDYTIKFDVMEIKAA